MSGPGPLEGALGAQQESGLQMSTRTRLGVALNNRHRSPDSALLATKYMSQGPGWR